MFRPSLPTCPTLSWRMTQDGRKIKTSVSVAPPPGAHLQFFFAGNKNRGFSTPPTQNETSLRKSTSNFVESDGILRSLSLVQYISSCGPKSRGALQHPKEALFNFGPPENNMSTSYDTFIIDHLSEHILYL